MKIENKSKAKVLILEAAVQMIDIVNDVEDEYTHEETGILTDEFEVTISIKEKKPDVEQVLVLYTSGNDDQFMTYQVVHDETVIGFVDDIEDPLILCFVNPKAANAWIDESSLPREYRISLKPKAKIDYE